MQGLGGSAGGSGAPGLNKAGSMSGNKELTGSVPTIVDAADIVGTNVAATATVTAVADCTAYCYAFGPGGKGDNSNTGYGGGGGEGRFRKLNLKKGETISLSAAAYRSSASATTTYSTITCPDGVMRAASGEDYPYSKVAGDGLTDIVRMGGTKAQTFDPNFAPNGEGADTTLQCGLGGQSSSIHPAGSGGGGFPDHFPGAGGGNGAGYIFTYPGFLYGGGGNQSGNPGNPGRCLVILVKG
jgi:hypothetical protein